MHVVVALSFLLSRNQTLGFVTTGLWIVTNIMIDNRVNSNSRHVRSPPNGLGERRPNCMRVMRGTAAPVIWALQNLSGPLFGPPFRSQWAPYGRLEGLISACGFLRSKKHEILKMQKNHEKQPNEALVIFLLLYQCFGSCLLCFRYLALFFASSTYSNLMFLVWSFFA